MFSQLVSDIIEASRNFILGFHHKEQPKIVKTMQVQSKSTVLIFRTFKEIFVSWHGNIPLKRIS